jgi:hypothetical protein
VEIVSSRCFHLINELQEVDLTETRTPSSGRHFDKERDDIRSHKDENKVFYAMNKCNVGLEVKLRSSFIPMLKWSWVVGYGHSTALVKALGTTEWKDGWITDPVWIWMRKSPCSYRNRLSVIPLAICHRTECPGLYRREV